MFSVTIVPKVQLLRSNQRLYFLKEIQEDVSPQNWKHHQQQIT